ncbi:MAG TPA: argininosuccinate lyase [Vicinamibacterales bacterium]|nr:argininosuccinate lyase [Vicinamibacterales bacterium]
MAALWSGRFDTEPDRATFEFGASFRFDRRLFEDDVTGSLAWVEALAEAGVLSGAERTSLSGALATIRDRGRQDPAFVDGPDEDVHTFVERLVVEMAGEAGKRLHTGRSRNEQVSLDLRLYLRRRLPLLRQAVVRLAGALVEQAGQAGEALMPAYTHLRPAQPILVAHFFLAHAAALRRDDERLAAAAREADALPLGSGAVAGTRYAIDVEALAARLGFSRVVLNSLDASSDRDFVLSFLHAAAVTMVHLSRLAEDLIIFCSDEFHFFELSDALSTGSSMMPQKKNPDPLELVRGKTGRVTGHLVAMLTAVKGLPSGYNKDLQEDKEAVFDAEDTLAGSLAAMTMVVSQLALDRARAERAASGLLLATDVADYLVGRGMPFRRAHEVVGALVRRLVAAGRSFDSLTLDEWRSASELFDGDIIEHVTPAASVRGKRTPQSTAPEAVAAALADLRGWIAGRSAGRTG